MYMKCLFPQIYKEQGHMTGNNKNGRNNKKTLIIITTSTPPVLSTYKVPGNMPSTSSLEEPLCEAGTILVLNCREGKEISEKLGDLPWGSAYPFPEAMQTKAGWGTLCQQSGVRATMSFCVLETWSNPTGKLYPLSRPTPSSSPTELPVVVEMLYPSATTGGCGPLACVQQKT